MVTPRETFGWRAKIGFITPAEDWRSMTEYYPVLPEGVLMTVTTLGVENLVAEDAQMVFDKYPSAARHLATQECDIIIAGGALVFLLVGYERSKEMIQKIRNTINIPVISDLEAHFDALRALNAKKIVIATPYEEARNQERKRVFEEFGFEVLSIKGLGIRRRVELGQQPHYASYIIAKQAFLEAPEADAIYISCPEWPTVRIIEKLEQDTGKPVVSYVTGTIWAALRSLNIKDYIKGYGRLFEIL